MKQILVITLGDEERTMEASFLGHTVEMIRAGCGGDADRAHALIGEFDGKVAAIGLEGLPTQLRLGSLRRSHTAGSTLPAAARHTPVVDGSGIRGGLERWAIILADRANPGIFSQKQVLMVPGLNHEGMSQALARRGSAQRYADPIIYFGMPGPPGVGNRQTLDRFGPLTLERLRNAPFHKLNVLPGVPRYKRDNRPFRWADLIAGDIGMIRHYAPMKLQRKIVVVEHANEDDLEDLKQRGVSIAITLMPAIQIQGEPETDLGRWSAATIEALLAALRPNPETPLTEDAYLDLMANIQWSPAVRYLQPREAGIHRFAFVIHPLSVSFIHKYPPMRWTRYLPDELVETVAAHIPPMHVGSITGGVSPATNQRIEGYLITLGATPRQMVNRDAHFTYRQLNEAARIAERKGARIMGLGAFTSVVGDAGITVAHEADIAITSGNSLTVAATLEAAKQAMIKMGTTDLTRGKAMVVGATGSIGSVCARLLAQAINDVVLVSIEPEKLIELKRKIQSETPGSHVTIATRADDHLGACDLIVTATSAFGQRIVDITRCKPGAVICDVARPPDISAAEAELRPDVLVIESGEVRIPGDINIGYDIGLPPKTVYACLAETALLAMEGRFEDYTLGRNITMERVKEIYRLFKKHDFQLAGLRSFGKFLSDEDFARKQELAAQLRDDPDRFARMREEAAAKLATIPVSSKGIKSSNNMAKWGWLSVGLGMAAALLIVRRQAERRR